MISHQRSGSHLLKGTLNSHNEHLDGLKLDGQRYVALPEIFHPGVASQFPRWTDWLFEPFLAERVLAEPLKWGNPAGISEATTLFLNHLRDRAEGQIVLADIKFNQLHVGENWYYRTTSPPRLLNGFSYKGKIIFLRRRNLVRCVVSELKAFQTGVWHNPKKNGRTLEPVKITVDVEQFLSKLVSLDRGLAQVEDWLSGYTDRVYSVYYEDLFDQKTLGCNRSTFDAIAAFGGLRQGADWQSPFKKIGTEMLTEIVENFDELREKIMPTKFAAMLSD